ncbi:MAG TPA: hypothetical protein VIH99_00545 [Bdellovibrionota bacterium]
MNLFSLLLSSYALASACPDAPQHPPQDGFQYVSDCSCSKKWKRVEDSKGLKGKLKSFSALVDNRWLPAYSCYRSQESQDEILKKNKCAPRFGTVQCSGRIAANLSEHTIGTAADFLVDNYTGQPEPLCHLLNQARKANGGRGGITVYGVDRETKAAALHIDDKEDWCNWGVCEGVLGEGYCRRTKFRQKQAALEIQQANAKLTGSQETLAQLTKALEALQADCPPGDLSCRDVYK